MCTVTFSPRKRGYALAMNRDEQLTRIVGLPPTNELVQGRSVLCPTEPDGGTWIALNDSGVTFALVNWYSVPATIKSNSASRGEVVRTVKTTDSPALTTKALEKLPLKRIKPFRLIGVFPGTRQILEWQWNLHQLVCKRHPWQQQQWISSGFDEPQAQSARGKIFQQALSQKNAGGLAWLRRLHRSHSPVVGPFSTCMHRPDAATVSYTEISVSARRGTMRYFGGAPCHSMSGGAASLSSWSISVAEGCADCKNKLNR